MEFRLGINLGDVIQEEDRIYGDGVNIAARLEGLAEPGGICISKTAFDHIESKLPYEYEFLGDQSVKNIAKPVGAYRVIMEPRVTIAGEPEKEKPASRRRRPIVVGVASVIVAAVAVGVWQFYTGWRSVEKMAYPLPEQPSIAVLPFANMSNDPEQEYFCDGIADQIINSIANIPSYSWNGSEDQARQAAKNDLRINPKFSVGYWEKRSHLKDRALAKQMFDAWRKAGLK
jgi:hypothetical protein